MELKELLGLLVSHNATGKGYQIQLNSGNLENKSNKNTGVEFGDLYFTECSTLRNTTLLCFGNSNRKPVAQKEDGTNLYPMEINSSMFIDVGKIEAIEDVQDFEDWFEYPSERVINLYMMPEIMNGHRNIVTIGLMDW